MAKKLIKKKVLKSASHNIRPAPTKHLPVPRELRVEPYWQELNKVIDPEINLGVVDLGLIYDVQIKAGKCKITMSLTTPACPYAPALLKQIEDRMRLYKDIKSVELKIVWDPVWSQDFIDPDIRDLMLGF
ncbi:metal-sulfur cluster assembly factor [Candidatus Peregrinibacteria bacterium]|nr:metal-sulfur cluster assembly factor [Candidatus Peregrinibacteria bacterium]